MTATPHARRWPFAALAMALFLAVLAVGPARAMEIVGEAEGVIQMEVNKGLLLRLERPASAIFVANPEVADIQVKSPRLVYIVAKRAGRTTLYAVDGEERVLANRQIAVDHNLSVLRDAMKALAPDAKIEVQSVESNIVLRGSVRSAAEAEEARRIAAAITNDPEKVLNQISVTAPSQVHLRVRVAEVSRQVLKKFGINWNAAFNPGNFLFGLATGGAITGAVDAFRNNILSGGIRTGRLDLNGLIDALDDEGLVTVLAEPNLTAISGKSANFLAGGEFPILVPDSNGKIGVVFKQFGVSLAFTPTLLGAERISLHVNPEVSQLSSNGAVEFVGFSVPALTTRRAETTVELGNGQSFAIAGLLQNDVTHDIGKFPGLGDIPMLGTLFRSDRFRRNESELVIIVTPYVVRPVSGPNLAAPTDGLRPPSDTDRVLHGRMHLPHPERGTSAPVVGGAHGAAGPVGFTLD